ncbi:TetR family transcriptional regulator [Streptomyces sp. NBC_00659]|uniref:TetR/AcrR family transcriptional regulator n=1 Tax=Streptomyces sp. NBC_00659 TaxID=2903669 RepID=UPI002E34FD76|nr:TetR family transcriptional regulator [Streptomyces sp. NBC_00659]
MDSTRESPAPRTFRDRRFSFTEWSGPRFTAARRAWEADGGGARSAAWAGGHRNRTALLDAAIDVLAREGSRGLTLRAVDARAGVPVGTSSNYFRNRDELLLQLMRRTDERIAPDPEQVADVMRAEPSTGLVALLLRQVHERMEADRAGCLAMLELRLDDLTVPEVLAPYAGDDLIGELARRLLPKGVT